jgi:hypothetical protein
VGDGQAEQQPEGDAAADVDDQRAEWERAGLAGGDGPVQQVAGRRPRAPPTATSSTVTGRGGRPGRRGPRPAP